jgi:1-acyl-sn-glycerol-3-phosphate acyltransferase
MAKYDPHRLDRRDPALVARVLPWLERFNRGYLRVAVEGHEHIRRGPVLYVANHSNGIADPAVAATLGALWRALGPDEPLYALAHDWAMRQVTPVGRVLMRFGALCASPAAAARALRRRASVLVYPGGCIDAFRPTREKHRVRLGERTGFVRLAQRIGVPIVPVVAEGTHESAWIVTDGERLARWLGTDRIRQPRFPIAVSAPWGLVLGPWLPYLPLPSRVRLRFLPEVRVAAHDRPEDVQRVVAASMQHALDDLAQRSLEARA